MLKRIAPLLLVTASLFAADTTYDGAKVHYESYGKGKDAVVFIHGWTCDTTFWRGQAPIYETHRALLIDLPGHGQSAKPDIPYTQERFARAVEAVMRAAGVERAVLVGHSMGGAVMLTFLRLFPAKVSGVVFVDAILPQTPKDAAAGAKQKAQIDTLVGQWRSPGYSDVAKVMIASMFSKNTTPAMREEIQSRMMSAPQYVMASAFEGMFAMDPPRQGESYDVPAMAVMVKRDGSAYEARLRSVFPKLGKYEEWDGSGHFLMIESPERFNKVLEDFLSGLK